MKITVIGAGYWGRNLVRNFSCLGSLYAVCDTNKALLNEIRQLYPNIKLFDNIEDVLKNSESKAVVVATPASTHYTIAKQCLKAGKHVLVEKPFTLSIRHTDELISIAKEKKLILMVGMTFIYNETVQKIKKLIQSDALGEIYYIYFERVNLGKVRQDVNVWWNLAPHDISIALYWLNSEVVNLNVKGSCYLQENIEDVVWANLKFKNNVSVIIHTSWLHPQKIRKAIVVGSKKMVLYDDTSPDMKIQIYDKGIDRKDITRSLNEYEDFGQFQLIHRAGDIHIPKVEFSEPLYNECRHFLKCIEKHQKPVTDGVWSREIVKLLELGQNSMNNHGGLVKV